MTKRLRDDSPMLTAAALFGAELARAMQERGITNLGLRTAARIGSTAAVSEWRHGRNMPGIETAQRLADALDWPRIATIVRDARTGRCRQCGTPIIVDAGRPRLYCTVTCRVIARALRDGAKPDGTARARTMLLDEVLRPGPARKQVIGRAVTMIEEARAVEIAQSEVLPVYRTAVGAFCRSCSGDLCRDAACPLRPVSPLDLSTDDREAVRATPTVRQPWSPQRLEIVQAANARRWARPGERERAARENRARLAAMTAEERAEHGRRISAGRRKERVA